MTAKQPSGGPEEPVAPRLITDPRTMRAVAHPLRLALLEALGREGELTATRAAELLDESPGNISWHFQTLAKYGYIEEAGGRKGRSRPWRLASFSNQFTATAENPEAEAAGVALAGVSADRAFAHLREWWAGRSAYPHAWREAAFLNNSLSYLTAEEMSELGEELAEVLARYRGRLADRELRPADARPVALVAFAHPLPPSASGN
jgi:DNA-binding transcriptional ArsR family regulator